MRSFTYTHKGWFLMCPVYFEGLESGEPGVDERHWSLSWWMDFNHWLCGAYIFIRTTLDAEYEPAFPFIVTGKLATPKTVTYPDLPDDPR